MARPLISNLSDFKNTINAAKGRIDGTVTKRYRALVTNILKDLAQYTPQATGDLAASWQVVVGASQEAHDLGPTPFRPVRGTFMPAVYQMGSKPARDYTLAINEFVIQSIRWNSKVSIQNANPTAQEIDPSRLRPGNFVVREDFMALSLVAARYSRRGMTLKV